jgi:AcrR family transcriptional regulator
MKADTTPLGARERRKRRTHDDLLRAGIDLFLTRGYDKTTVLDIARVAEVSERTFFRYFASKEELVLWPLRTASEVLLDEVRRRPAEDDPMRALREGGLTTLRLVTTQAPQLYLGTLRVISAEPDARAASLRLGADEQRKLAALLAAREGVAPDDLRPLLLAGAFMAAAIQTTLTWDERTDGSLDSLEETAEGLLALLPQAVSGGWHGGAGARRT